MMETEGIQTMASYWKKDGRIVGVIKDGDVKTHKYFRDSILEDGLEEYFDPNHKKKEIKRNFLAYNAEHDGILTDLLEDILNQFGKACHLKKDLREKLEVWRAVPEYIKNKYETIGFLKQEKYPEAENQTSEKTEIENDLDKSSQKRINTKQGKKEEKRKVSSRKRKTEKKEKPISENMKKTEIENDLDKSSQKRINTKQAQKEEKRKASLRKRKTQKKEKPISENVKKTFTEDEADIALRKFLEMNETLVIKCSKGTTQSNESFHELKSFFAKKNISWRTSWNLRMKLAVLRWNEGFNMIKMLWDTLQLPPLPPECQELLEDIWKSREKAKESRSRDDYNIIRNYVRGLKKKTNPPDPAGHGYVDDKAHEMNVETLNNIYDDEPKLNEIHVDRLQYMPDDEEATLPPSAEESIQLYYCSIPNIGQSCYASSAIQILRIGKFLDVLRQIQPRPLIRVNTLFGSLIAILKKCESRVAISNADIASLLRSSLNKYLPDEPADVIEFMEDIFQSGVQIFTRGKCCKFGPFYDNYYTAIQEEIKCISCGSIKSTTQLHPILRCNITDQTNTLNDCLSLIQEEQVIEEFFCSNCQCQTSAKIHQSLTILPKYLIIGLNRQEINRVNDKVITFEPSLTIDSFTYILKGVVYYYHYTYKSAHYDVRGVLTESNKLYIFNDNICKRCNQDFPFPRATVFIYEQL